MRKFETLTRIYETFTEAWLPGTEDELDADLMAPFFGPANFDPDDYSQVQRRFGWDDTH